MKNFSKTLVACLYLCSSVVMACSCFNPSLAEKVSGADNIFIVETNKIETVIPAGNKEVPSGKRKAYFKVLETLKGSSTGTDFIVSAEKPICCMCHSKVKNKTKYLVFNNGGDIHLGSCSATRILHNHEEESETIKALLMPSQPSEVFTGVYVSNNQLFLNDDGSKTKLLQFATDGFYTPMSRVSFEGIRLPSGKLMVTNLHDELALTEQEIEVIEESLEATNQTSVNKEQ